MALYISFYILTLLIATSLLFTWFRSSLPSLTFTVLKLLGLKRRDQKFWTVPSDEMFDAKTVRSPLTWTRADWEGTDLQDGWAITRLGNFFGSLLTCRYCLCYHIVFWVNLIAWLICSKDVNIYFALASFLSQPILVHILFNITDRLNKE